MEIDGGRDLSLEPALRHVCRICLDMVDVRWLALLGAAGRARFSRIEMESADVVWRYRN